MSKKVAILGGGNFGTAIGNILARSLGNRNVFDKNIKIWIYDEIVDGGSLCEQINKRKENFKYLPGVVLPSNLTFVTTDADYVQLLREADILIYILPTFVAKKFALDLKKYDIRNKEVVTLMKGFIGIEENKPLIFTEFVCSLGLGHKVASLMGANIAGQMHKGPCEMTFGRRDEGMAAEQLFCTKKTHITAISDYIAVELCGALKNIVAIAFGLCDGLKLNVNTQMCVLRKGLLEINDFIFIYKETLNQKNVAGGKDYLKERQEHTNNNFIKVENIKGNKANNIDKAKSNEEYEHQGVSNEIVPISGHVMFESCGIPDLLATCISGRNSNGGKRLGQGESLKEIEDSMNGQKIHGISTAEIVYDFLMTLPLDIRKKFKLFMSVHEIAHGQKQPDVIESVFYD